MSWISLGGGLNDDHVTGEPGPESALYTAVVLPGRVLTQGPVSIEDARGGGRGRPVGLGTMCSLKQEAGSRTYPPSALGLLCSATGGCLGSRPAT